MNFNKFLSCWPEANNSSSFASETNRQQLIQLLTVKSIVLQCSSLAELLGLHPLLKTLLNMVVHLIHKISKMTSN